MSTDNKKILLTLFITIDCLLGILIFKAMNPLTSSKTKDVSLKNKANFYQKVDEFNKEKDIKEEKEIIEEEKVIVFDNKTYDELVIQINNSLNDDLSMKGELIVSHSLELGVDPYLVTAIMLQETGCQWSCSYNVKACNNVGGQKGYGCGDYQYFDTLDNGIIAMIDNIYNNYYVYGLTTPELINPMYAEDYNWSYNVNRYIEFIRNN